MLHFLIENGECVKMSTTYKQGYISRLDFTSMYEATQVAHMASAYTRVLHIAVEHGRGFDVVRCPQVGDDISQSFNGDAYPDGQITSISLTMRVIQTSTGSKYYRVGKTNSWLKHKTWSLVNGQPSEQNPHI